MPTAKPFAKDIVPHASRPPRDAWACPSALSLLLLAASAAHAQLPATQPPLIAPDPAIAAAIANISPDQIHADIEHLVAFPTRNTLSSDSPTNITAAADFLFSEFTRISDACNHCLQVRRDDFIEPASTGPGGRIPKPTRLQNIYAILPGTDPAQAPRRVLVTGHYDSRNTDVLNPETAAPGANDDASGVAVSLECARVLSKLKFPATIIFVAVAGEEQGLNGSRHLAKLAKSEGWNLEAVLNNDIVGGDLSPGQRTDTVRIFSEGVPGPATPEQIRAIQNLGAESDSPSRELARAIDEVALTYFPAHGQGSPIIPGRPHNMLVHLVPGFRPTLIFRRDRFLRGGDHTSFNAEGFAAVRFTEYQENFTRQHQNLRTENGPQGNPVEYGDLLKFVDTNYVAEVARLNAASLANFASAPGQPENVHILTKALDNSTDLTWTAPAGAPANTLYQVLYRPTDAPNWTAAAPATPALTLHLPISKDNTIFAIRAVDPRGHTSPTVLPTPSNK